MTNLFLFDEKLSLTVDSDGGVFIHKATYWCEDLDMDLDATESVRSKYKSSVYFQELVDNAIADQERCGVKEWNDEKSFLEGCK